MAEKMILETTHDFTTSNEVDVELGGMPEPDLEPETTAVAVIDETKRTTLAIADALRAATVNSAKDYTHLQVKIQRSADYEKQWDELTGPAKKKSYEAYQAALRLHDDPIAELKAARSVAKLTCMIWYDEQERLRREEQRRLEEEARKQAEEEQLAAALQAEAEGDTESAQAIIEEAYYVPPVIVPKPAVEPSRLTAGRSAWSAEVVSLMELIKAVAAGTAPITCIEPNMVTLNQLARGMKSAMRIPGVRAVERKV